VERGLTVSSVFSVVGTGGQPGLTAAAVFWRRPASGATSAYVRFRCWYDKCN